MKSIIAFIPSITRMLVQAGINVTQLVNACNSAAGDVKSSSNPNGQVHASQGDVKLSAFSPKAKGSEIHWSESDKTDYKAKKTSPLAFVAWHDAIARVEKIHGTPSGEYTMAIVPETLFIWVSTTFKVKGASGPAVDVKTGNGNGRGKPVKAPKVPTPTTPAVPTPPVPAGK